jgi:adenylate cyclase
MLTDMVGYSKDMERDEQGTYQRLLVHNEIVRASIANHQGREIKTIGDAFLALFTSAMSAVDCAISIQEAFFDFNANRPASEQILIRIGVHLGDVLITEDDIYGDGVNVAARIEPLADPGGICVSEEVYSLVRKRIELKVEQLDNPSLKNISVAPRIYKVHFR